MDRATFLCKFSCFCPPGIKWHTLSDPHRGCKGENGLKYLSVCGHCAAHITYVPAPMFPCWTCLRILGRLKGESGICLSPSAMHDHTLRSHCFIHLNWCWTVTRQGTECGWEDKDCIMVLSLQPVPRAQPTRLSAVMYSASWSISETCIPLAARSLSLCLSHSVWRLVRSMWLFRYDARDTFFCVTVLHILIWKKLAWLYSDHIRVLITVQAWELPYLVLRDPIVWPKYIVVWDRSLNAFCCGLDW